MARSLHGDVSGTPLNIWGSVEGVIIWGSVEGQRARPSTWHTLATAVFTTLPEKFVAHVTTLQLIHGESDVDTILRAL